MTTLPQRIRRHGRLYVHAAASKTITLTFYDCDHHGDAEQYAADLTASGAKVLGTKMNWQASQCEITFEVPTEQWASFEAKFRWTHAFQHAPGRDAPDQPPATKNFAKLVALAKQFNGQHHKSQQDRPGVWRHEFTFPRSMHSYHDAALFGAAVKKAFSTAKVSSPADEGAHDVITILGVQ
jgi:hypothetical protein